MRSRYLCAFGWLIGATTGIGCLADGASLESEDIASTSDPIQGGQLETGFLAVGELVLGNGSFCSGTLIAPSYVLTAAHCAGSGMVFKTGTDSSNFVSHPVDQQIAHPTLDLLVVHLASPLSGIPLIQVNDGALPAVNTVCTGVGFGWHDVNGVTTSGTKRSATEQVTSANAAQIVVQMVTGIADHGDSGGPLLCSSRIAAVVHNHTDGNWPQHVVENYTTVDGPWIASTIAPAYSELALQNGWTNAPFSTRNAGVSLVSGIVQFKGAIAGGSTSVAFTLPVGFRPATNVYVPVDLCSTTKGRLVIQPSGIVSVDTGSGPFSNAQCFTSLEGASFAPSATGFTSLTLGNGWTNAPFGTSNAAVANIGGIVHFKGAIANGSPGTAFTLPVGFRPASPVWLPIDLCGAANGRLVIQPSGAASVEAQGGAFASAQCFTSLDGASFAADASAFTALTLQNGWTNSAFGAGTAGVENLSGVLHFKGAIAGGSGTVFTLPSAFRPATTVYVAVDLCSTTNGRLVIQPSGAVSVDAEGGALANAQCFTSLDGASFVVSEFTPLSLQGSWSNAPFGNADGAFALISGIIHFKGAISTAGSDPFAFMLPIGFRPATSAYVPVDLCGATKGRLIILSSGAVSVQAEGAFSSAQCFTSLEGASFALSTAGFTALTLLNSWTNAPFSTRNAAVINDAGIIRLEGAISSGTTGLAFTLPVGFRPAKSVYLPVDLCTATKGRLFIESSGDVTVVAENGTFTNAQCFTSLEGASFALSTGGFTALAPQNGWTNAPFATRDAAVTNDAGIIRLQGAIASGTIPGTFTLPVGFRPSANVWVPVDLCGAVNGRLVVSPGGTVTVEAENGAFTSAQCFTSLEGVAFAL